MKFTTERKFGVSFVVVERFWYQVLAFMPLIYNHAPTADKDDVTKDERKWKTSTPFEGSVEVWPRFQLARNNEEKNRIVRYCLFGYNRVNIVQVKEDVDWFGEGAIL